MNEDIITEIIRLWPDGGPGSPLVSSLGTMKSPAYLPRDAGRHLRLVAPTSPEPHEEVGEAVRQRRIDMVSTEPDAVRRMRPYWVDPIRNYLAEWDRRLPPLEHSRPVFAFSERLLTVHEAAVELGRRSRLGGAIRAALLTTAASGWLADRAAAGIPDDGPLPWRVVVADDDKGYAETLCDHLSNLWPGHHPDFETLELTCHSEATDAIEAARTADGQRLIMLVDERFAGQTLTGLDIIAKTRDLRPDAECFVLSGQADDRRVFEIASHSGVLHYWYKAGTMPAAIVEELYRFWLFDDVADAFADIAERATRHNPGRATLARRVASTLYGRRPGSDAIRADIHAIAEQEIEAMATPDIDDLPAHLLLFEET